MLQSWAVCLCNVSCLFVTCRKQHFIVMEKTALLTFKYNFQFHQFELYLVLPQLQSAKHHETMSGIKCAKYLHRHISIPKWKIYVMKMFPFENIQQQQQRKKKKIEIGFVEIEYHLNGRKIHLNKTHSVCLWILSMYCILLLWMPTCLYSIKYYLYFSKIP